MVPVNFSPCAESRCVVVDSDVRCFRGSSRSQWRRADNIEISSHRPACFAQLVQAEDAPKKKSKKSKKAERVEEPSEEVAAEASEQADDDDEQRHLAAQGDGSRSVYISGLPFDFKRKVGCLGALCMRLRDIWHPSRHTYCSTRVLKLLLTWRMVAQSMHAPPGY